MNGYIIHGYSVRLLRLSGISNANLAVVSAVEVGVVPRATTVCGGIRQLYAL